MTDDFGTRLEPRARNAFEPIRANFQNGLPQVAPAQVGIGESGVVMFNPPVRQPEPARLNMKITPPPGSPQELAARTETIARTRQATKAKELFALVDKHCRTGLTDNEALTLQRLGEETALDRFFNDYFQQARTAIAAEQTLAGDEDFEGEIARLDQQIAAADEKLQKFFDKIRAEAAPLHQRRAAIAGEVTRRQQAAAAVKAWRGVLALENMEIPLVQNMGTHRVLHPLNEQGR